MSVKVVVTGSEPDVVNGVLVVCQGLGWQVSGQYTSPMSALAGIVMEEPDFVILDANMDGAKLVRDIRQMRSRARCIMLAAGDEAKPLLEALEAGTDAYLVRDGWVSELPEALDIVRAGGVYTSPSVKRFGDADDEEEAGLAGACEPRPPRYPRPHRAVAQDFE
jgi:DNA-binding NarL/FixJ family response regulator